MTVKYSKLYISKYRIFLFRYTRRKKTATAFYVCAVFELQFLFMQPVYRFSLLSGKVSIIDGFRNNIALPVIQRADRNIMHTQLPQIVQRYTQKQAHAIQSRYFSRGLHARRYSQKPPDSDALHHESFHPAAESIRPDA